MNARKHTGIIALVVSVLAIAGIFVYRELQPAGAYVHNYGYGYGGHMMFGMDGLMVVYWGLILFGLILLINWLLTANRKEHDSEFRSSAGDALEILKSRYARGDIDLEQFKKMRDEISR